MGTKAGQVEFRRLRRRRRIRRKLEGSAERPRVSVFRSSKYIYAQVIDDTDGHTVASVSSRDAAVKELLATVVVESGQSKSSKSSCAGYQVGQELGKKLLELGVTGAVFDRSGYRYAGRVKAIADGAREAGLAI
jgi:large subunit ribosomal protein L18